uniref:Transcriptional regulator n=1 Tax=Steinernema glaseri TaxID=37863 RepID=A0A1I8APN5_9BILA
MHGLEEVLVGTDHIAFGGELDHRHGTADGIDQAVALMLLDHPPGDVGGDLDHAGDLLVGAEHRHVAGLQPHIVPGLVAPQKGTAVGLAPRQVAPQGA